MRNYGSVSSLIYRNEDYRSLSESGRLLFLYLLTCNHGNMIGCFNLPSSYAIDDLQWTKEHYAEIIAELLNNHFVIIDEKREWILIPKYLKWNPPLNPNVGKSMVRLFHSIPDNIEVKKDMYQEILKYGKHIKIETISESFRNDSIPVPVPVPDNLGVVGEKIDKKEREELFAKFWELYPNKVDKKETLDLFVKLPEDKFQEMRREYPRWLKMIRTPSTTEAFIPSPPSPARFIRKEKWNDDFLTQPDKDNGNKSPYYEPEEKSMEQIKREYEEATRGMAITEFKP